MKRPKSYGEDLDVAAEKGGIGGKDWGRRDADLDRSSSSSSLLHRRFYPKGSVDNGRRGGLASSASPSYDRSLDDERDGTSRSSRKPRFDHDHDPDSFDRTSRKAFDRYRDSGGGAADPRTASPRVGYGGERMHRSDSFSSSSSFRRDIPKGFRSDRDRVRRDDARRRSGCGGNRDSEGDSKFGSDRASHRAVSEDRAAPSTKSPPALAPPPPPAKEAPHRSKELGSGRSRNVESMKAEEAHDKSGSSSEMEEGELEPEPQSEPQLPPEEPLPELEAPPTGAAGGECDKQLEVESNVGPNSCSEMDAKMEEAADVEMKTKVAEDDDKVNGGENDGSGVATAEEMSKAIVNSEENVSEPVENDEMVVACVSRENEDDRKEEQKPLHTAMEEKIVEGTDVEASSSPGGRAMDRVPSSLEVTHLERRGFDLEMEAGDFENHDSTGIYTKRTAVQ